MTQKICSLCGGKLIGKNTFRLGTKKYFFIEIKFKKRMQCKTCKAWLIKR